MAPNARTCWHSPRLLVSVFLIFLSGALVGALAMRLGMRGRQASPAAFYTIDGQKVAVNQLAKELELNTVQTQQLETILDDFVMYVQMLESQMDEVRASGKARILNILNEKQKAKFEKMAGELQPHR